MFGLPVTYFKRHLENYAGYIIAIDANTFPLEKLIAIIAANSYGEYERIEQEVSLEELYKIFNEHNKNLSFYYSGDIIYIYFNSDKFPYHVGTMFIIEGIRTTTPIKDLDDHIDIPEKYLELFVNYLIKYAHEIKNIRVPANVTININNLEKQLKEG